MKMYFLFSLSVCAPLLLRAEKISQMFDDQKEVEYVDEYDVQPLENIPLKFFSSIEENTPEVVVQEEITYENVENSPPVENLTQMQAQTKKGEQFNGFTLPIDHAGYIGFAEFLWWKLNETSLDYAIHKNFPTTTEESDESVFLGHVHTVDIDYAPGFRVGMGYRFSKDLWELSGIYTYFYADGDDDVKCGQCQFNNPNLPSWIGMTVASFGLDALIGAKANLRFWYHIGDIELAKPLSWGGHTFGRFIVGPSVGFIQQHFNILSIDNMNTFTPCPAQLIKSKLHWSFSGGGIKIGMDSHWNVFNRFNFLFGGHLTALYGYYVNTYHATRFMDPVGLVCPQGANTPLRKLKYSDWTLKDRRNIFGTRIFGGVSYNYPFKKCNLELYINYELNTWFNLTDQYRIRADTLLNEFEIRSAGEKVRSLSSVPLNIAGVDFGAKINF